MQACTPSGTFYTALATSWDPVMAGSKSMEVYCPHHQALVGKEASGLERKHLPIISFANTVGVCTETGDKIR